MVEFRNGHRPGHGYVSQDNRGSMMPCYWIKDGFRLEKIDTEQWFKDKLEQFKDDPAYLEEKRRLEMDEITIAKIIDKYCHKYGCPTLPSITIAQEILTLIKDAGYLPPEYGEVVTKGIEGAIEVLKGKGWKSPEEIRELNDFWFNRGKEGR